MSNETIREILGSIFEDIVSDFDQVFDAISLDRGSLVLDVGTGIGTSAVLLALRGFEVITGEPESDDSHYASRDWKTHAAEAGVLDRIQFQSFDAGSMPFESERFDSVVFFGVLHHIPVRQRRAVIFEGLRVCRKDHPIVFLEPTAQTIAGIRKRDPGHPEAASPATVLAAEEAEIHHVQGRAMDLYFVSQSPA